MKITWVPGRREGDRRRVVMVIKIKKKEEGDWEFGMTSRGEMDKKRV